MKKTENSYTISLKNGYIIVPIFILCAGHGMSSVGDKPTTGSYRQV